MKLLGWSKCCFVVTPSCALHDARMDFGTCLAKWNPKFEFLHEFFENFKTNKKGTWCKHHLTCDCAPWCVPNLNPIEQC